MKPWCKPEVTLGPHIKMLKSSLLNPNIKSTLSPPKKCYRGPQAGYSCTTLDQKTRASFYSLSHLHTHCCICNKVCSLATLCLWFPSHAALKLCFINSCIGVPAHSCFMNNSYCQAERSEPNININTDMATFCHRPCVFFFLSYFFLYSPLLLPTHLCLLELKGDVTVQLCCMDLKLFTFSDCNHSLSPNKFYCLPTETVPSFSSFPLLSCCKITICLIVGDSLTPQQLGCTQIICYTSLSPFLSLVLSFTGLLSSIFSSAESCDSSHSHICEVSALW